MPAGTRRGRTASTTPRFLETTLDSATGLALVTAERAAAPAMAAQRWDDAFEIFSRLYEEMLQAQPEGRRYHKGLPLHNMGLTRLLGNRGEEGLHFTLLAFIEDALSRGEESPQIHDELARPAAQNLVYVFNLPGRFLGNWSLRLRDAQRTGALYSDPEVAFAEVPPEPDILPVPAEEPVAIGRPSTGGAEAHARPVEEEEGAPPEVPPSAASGPRIAEAPPRWRIPGLFGTRWEDRVFVAGSTRSGPENSRDIPRGRGPFGRPDRALRASRTPRRGRGAMPRSM